jgi:hypothetical protein
MRGWMQYFSEHFPRGDEHAERLWIRWRVAQLKDEYPGHGVAVSHGQPHGHWQMIEPWGLFIDLESMRDDFVKSVDSFIEMLRSDELRRSAALEYWAKHRWSVQAVISAQRGVATTASVTLVTAWHDPQ